MERLKILRNIDDPELEEGLVRPKDFINISNKVNEIIDRQEKIVQSLQYLAMQMSDRDEKNYIQHINEILKN